MATKKVFVRMYVSVSTKADMELLYNGLHGAVTEGRNGHGVHVDISRSVYWESVIRGHLKDQEDLIRIFRMKRNGEFCKE